MSVAPAGTPVATLCCRTLRKGTESGLACCTREWRGQYRNRPQPRQSETKPTNGASSGRGRWLESRSACADVVETATCSADGHVLQCHRIWLHLSRICRPCQHHGRHVSRGSSQRRRLAARGGGGCREGRGSKNRRSVNLGGLMLTIIHRSGPQDGPRHELAGGAEGAPAAEVTRAGPCRPSGRRRDFSKLDSQHQDTTALNPAQHQTLYSGASGARSRPSTNRCNTLAMSVW